MAEEYNALIIMSDQHNKAIMGCAGDPIIRTPNLDRLASEGMLFSSAYTPSPLCVPARMSFMTSKYPSNNQIWANRQIMSTGTLTWPHMVTLAGYETCLIGRMHFEGPDQVHGFEKRPFAEPFAVYPGMHFTQRVYQNGVPADSGQGRSVMLNTGGKGKGCYEAFDECATEHVCDYLREKATETDGRPFAAVVGYLLPHCPFIGDPEAFDYYYQRLPDADVSQEYLDNLPEGIKRYLTARKLDTPLTADRVRACQAAYYAMVENMDKMIGKILGTLEETGLARNTMVMYVSDHGEQLNVHGCWTKSCYYEGSAGIPMIVRYPGVIKPGSSCDAPVSLVDIGPTLLEMAEGEPLPYADGSSLLPLMKGEDDGGDRAVISELYDSVCKVGSGMIRKGPWKLWVISDDSPDILFNLDEDPDEEKNLAASPDCQEIKESLKLEFAKVVDFDFMTEHVPEMGQEYRYISKWAQLVQPMLPETEQVPIEGQSYEHA